MNSNHEPIKQFAKSAILMTGLAAAIATISGCGAESDEQANNAPYAEGVNFTVQTQSETNYTLPAEDADGDTLEYTLVSEPTIGQATLDSATGEMTYISGSIVGTDEFMIEVSDGEDSVMATVSIQVQSDAVFNYQFYSVPNPETTNSQIVRYDPNNPDNETNQQVIKDNIILGSQVFAISAAKDGNKTVYEKREYGFYLDPNASSETRTADDGEGGVFEYEFYTNNIFKRFEADNPAAEAVVFTSTMLGSDLGGQGLAAVGDTYDLYLNPTDIDNSYAELRAYSHLPDTFRGETSDGIKNTFVTVRLADSAFVQGRTVQPVVNDSTGATDKVLVNYLAVTNHDGSYPEDESEAAHLQVCDAALTNCESLGELALGEFYFKAQNADYIYLNKEGSDSYYAFNKADDSFAEVTGANFPAPFEAIRHTIQKGLGHGGGGILQDFSSLTIVNGYLAEDDVAYALVNYNLDLQDPVWMFYGYYPQYTFKNAMVVQFEGTTATKIYDNGTGVDLGDESDEVPVNNQINLTAVIDGNLYVELGRYDTENAVNILSTGWITAGKTEASSELDVEFNSQEVPYFTAHHVPAVAVDDQLYVVEAPTDNGNSGRDEDGNRIYNLYIFPTSNTMPSKADIEPVRGRMFFERSASTPAGIFDGSVITWNIVDGEVKNQTDDIVLGFATEPAGEAEGELYSNAYSGNTGNKVGVGGLFGLHMSSAHGGPVGLASAKSDTGDSLTIINTIASGGNWIYN